MTALPGWLHISGYFPLWEKALMGLERRYLAGKNTRASPAPTPPLPRNERENSLKRRPYCASCYQKMGSSSASY